MRVSCIHICSKDSYLPFLLTYQYLPWVIFQTNSLLDGCICPCCVFCFCRTSFRSIRSEVFCKKGVLKCFAKFTGKHLCQSLFNKVADFRPLSWEFAKFLRTPIFIEHLRWLLLFISISICLFKHDINESDKVENIVSCAMLPIIILYRLCQIKNGTRICCYPEAVVSKVFSVLHYSKKPQKLSFFFYLGFLSRPFKNNRTGGEGGEHLFL